MFDKQTEDYLFDPIIAGMLQANILLVQRHYLSHYSCGYFIWNIVKAKEKPVFKGGKEGENDDITF